MRRHRGKRTPRRPLRPHIDYNLDTRNQNIEITYEGLNRAEEMLRVEQIHDAPNGLLTALYHALHARHLLTRDIDYLVRDNRIIPIDEYKGRTAHERRWPAATPRSRKRKAWKSRNPAASSARSLSKTSSFNTNTSAA